MSLHVKMKAKPDYYVHTFTLALEINTVTEGYIINIKYKFPGEETVNI